MSYSLGNRAYYWFYYRTNVKPYKRFQKEKLKKGGLKRIKKDIKLANTIIIFQEEMQKIMEYKNNFDTP